MSLASLSLTDYARKLASADPTPGGGSAAAAVAALAAGLVRMVAELTAGSPKFSDVAPRAKSLGAIAAALSDELLACVDEDVVAFDKVSAAYKMPRADDAQKASRSVAIQRALAVAAEPPLRVVELAERACGLAAELVDFGTPNAVSDLGCAAAFAQAAAQGAAFNVEINARSLKDRSTADALTARARAALAQVDIQAEVVLGKVNVLIAGGD
jgi:formiminotetrahydrofolate cyclodeaminase